MVKDRRGEMGITAMEVVICLGILGFLASSLVVVESKDFRFARESHDRVAALKVCTSRLEAFAAGAAAPEPGERAFTVPADLARRLSGAAATERIRPAGPGLVSVEVRVRWVSPAGEPREERLATLRAVEERP